jgi:hypothetical protein
MQTKEELLKMKRNSIRIGALAALFLCLVATVVFAAQDLFTLK